MKWGKVCTVFVYTSFKTERLAKALFKTKGLAMSFNISADRAILPASPAEALVQLMLVCGDGDLYMVRDAPRLHG